MSNAQGTRAWESIQTYGQRQEAEALRQDRGGQVHDIDADLGDLGDDDAAGAGAAGAADAKPDP